MKAVTIPNMPSSRSTWEVEEAAARMLATGFRHLPVVDGDAILGIVSIKDVLWAIADETM